MPHIVGNVLGAARRFRTIQVRPKDLSAFPGQPKREVCWHSGFQRGAHGPRQTAPIYYFAPRRGTLAARGAGAAATYAGVGISSRRSLAPWLGVSRLGGIA